jgi:hypothetical protein
MVTFSKKLLITCFLGTRFCEMEHAKTMFGKMSCCEDTRYKSIGNRLIPIRAFWCTSTMSAIKFKFLPVPSHEEEKFGKTWCKVTRVNRSL